MIHLYDQWAAQAFDNISDSEQSHLNAVLALLNKQALAEAVAGSFANQILFALYDDLIKTGAISKAHAFEIGTKIEEIDIIDLRRELAPNIDNEDIIFVFRQLLKGSENHQRAFVKKLTILGVQYTAQYLNLEAFDAIINQGN